ncbi:MAG TPA: amino acid adenylation domain-containing protein, partial [Burkholderiaceae bacterium]|nr:amino acid adenylation domain-containing protein [Burkholderiaceae bacterium]
AWQSRQFQPAPAAEQAACSGNHDAAPAPDGGLLHEGPAHALQCQGTGVAVWAGSQALSHAQLDRWSMAIAGQLLRQAVQPQELVAVVMDRGPAIAAAVLGILRAGAAYVPVEPTLPPERQRYMLDNAQVRVVLTTAKYRDAMHGPESLAVFAVDVEADVPQDPPLPAEALRRADPGDLAYVIYTSGSTGRPKGVMIDHRAARNTVVDINRRFGVGRDDVLFGVSSFGFDLSVYDLFGALEAGAALVYPDPEAALNPAHWLDLMLRHRATIWNSAPALAGLLVETAQRRRQVLPALRLVLLSGDWIPVELPAQIRQVAPNARVISLGGATEAAIWSIWYDTAELDPAWPRIPYGKPLSNQAWHVRDAQNRPTPVWTAGDLYISGAGLARGYWRDAEKTQAAFIQDAVTGQRLYRTGDRGRYLPDGHIEFLGRADTQVKIQGHRIELGEIESVLGAHPQVKDCVVLVRSSGTAGTPQLVQANTGPGALEIVACVVPGDGAAGAEALVEQLRQAVAERLPAYMVPGGWAVLAQMPLSPNGKVDRQALARVPDVRRGGPGVALAQAPVAPRTETERRLARIWEQVLKQPVASVRDDFFACGGQSIDAVRCVARIHEQFDKLLSLADLWQHRTIESLAGRLEAHDAEAPLSNLVSLAARSDAGEPWFMVHPAGGQCVGYHELAKRLDRPCFGLVAHPQEAGTGALADVRQIARRYVDAVMSIQRTGPHRLLGWSSGGCIAHAMAAELEARGSQVSELVLVDCPAPLVHDTLSDAALLRCFVEDLNLGLAVADLQFLEGPGLDKPAGFGRAIRQLNERLHLDLEAEPLHRMFRVFREIVSAVRAYQPDRIGANLSVLRATQGQVTEFKGHPDEALPHWGWSRLTRGAVRCAGIEGTHYTMLAGPGVHQVAAWLNGRPGTEAAAPDPRAAMAAS